MDSSTSSHPSGSSPTHAVRALPGESTKKTTLFHPFLTPASALNEWGIGVDLYFSTLRVVAAVFAVMALINAPTVFWYAGEGKKEMDNDSLTLQGSAICAEKQWSVCLD
jgi:hypothetical protein